jgi:predicted amidohydrolase YtcJ
MIAQMDCIIINADVRTMAEPPNAARATAVAVRGNRISHVGDTSEVRATVNKNAKVIDAQGRLLLPGFNDAHVHFLDGGFSLANIHLRDAGTPEEFTRRIAEHARTLPAGKWIRGGEWDHEQWPGAPLPTRKMIDRVTQRNPVFVSRTDGHMALANSLALNMAGITRKTPDMPGGFIVRDQTGEPTGLLKDAAMNAVWRATPAPDIEEKKAAARRATEFAAKLGVTSVQDVLAGDDVEIYRELARAGQLKTRVYGLYPIARWEEVAGQPERLQNATGLVRVGGVKGFSDGSLGSATAWFFEPFVDNPKNCGLPGEQMFPEGAMLERALAADKAGLQVAIHAIGDRANFEVLELFKAVAERNGPRDRRFRVEHAQHLRPREIARFCQQQVIASVQPYHAIDDGRWCESRLGPRRLAGTYAFRSLLDAGAALALGSDWTVAPLTPMLTIRAAVTRSTLDGKHPGGWLPDEKITVEEAVRAYTMGSAFAEFAERDKGSIAPGKLADLILVDKNIFEIPSGEIQTARSALTMIDGEVVWDAG